MSNVNAQNVAETTDELAGLFAELGLNDSFVPGNEDEEIIEEQVLGELEMESAAPSTAPDPDLEKDVVMSLETQEAVEKHYESVTETEVAPGDTPQTPEVKKAKRARKPKDPSAVKESKAERKFYASKVERVTDKLGANLGAYTVLTLSDAALEGDELAAKQKETLEIMGKAGVKVQNRMTLLLEFVAGHSSKLNEVIERAFKILKKDGFIKSGEKGNFHTDLMTKYSVASARAMGNNTIATLRDFHIIVKGADGSYVANPDSLILIKANDLLGLS